MICLMGIFPHFKSLAVSEQSNKSPSISGAPEIVTDEMKTKILQKFSQEFPDVDLSDFAIVYSEISYGNGWRIYFDVYYKDLLIYEIPMPGESNVTIGYSEIFNEDFLYITNRYVIENCLKIDVVPKITEKQINQIIMDRFSLQQNSDVENFPWDLVIYNTGWDKLNLAYRIEDPDFVELIVDANTGEFLDDIYLVTPKPTEPSIGGVFKVGSEKTFDNSTKAIVEDEYAGFAFVDDGKAYVPMRVVQGVIGAKSVDYSEEDETVTYVFDNYEIIFTIDSVDVQIKTGDNIEKVTILGTDVPQIIDSKAFIPSRVLSQLTLSSDRPVGIEYRVFDSEEYVIFTDEVVVTDGEGVVDTKTVDDMLAEAIAAGI